MWRCLIEVLKTENYDGNICENCSENPLRQYHE